MSPKDFLAQLYGLFAADKRTAGLDLIFDTFDSWLEEGKFDLMNEVHDQVDLTKIPTSAMVSLLVQTFKYDMKVSNHAALVIRIETYLRDSGESEKRIEGLLSGLRTCGDYWKNMEMLGAPEWIAGPKPF